jgi:hypothetical protein
MSWRRIAGYAHDPHFHNCPNVIAGKPCGSKAHPGSAALHSNAPAAVGSRRKLSCGVYQCGARLRRLMAMQNQSDSGQWNGRY